jgi:hypothetical protein
MAADPDSDGIITQRPAGDRGRERLQLGVGDRQRSAVAAKEQLERGCANPLVPIPERVVLDQRVD